MLFLLYGEDIAAISANLKALERRAEQSGPTDHFRFDAENFSIDDLRELERGATMFAEHHVVVLSELLSVPEVADAVLAELPALGRSPHHFIFIEHEVPIVLRHSFKEAGASIVEAAAPAKRGAALNPFLVADALVTGDRKQLWLALQRAERSGLDSEEIFWKVAWQLKAMRLAARAESEAASGLKPFVYKKSLAGAKRLGFDRLDDLGRSLVGAYTAARRGDSDLDIALERWVLGI